MSNYQTIPSVANEDGDAGGSKSAMERIVSVVTSKGALGTALVCSLLALGVSSSSRENPAVVTAPKTPESTLWPPYLESSLGTGGNPYAPKDTAALNTPRRPRTTEEATEQGWKKVGEDCAAGLGYPWAFDGEVSFEAPVTMYFTDDGVVNGIGIHYYNDTAPTYLVERGVFKKEEDYDTISVTFSATDVCDNGVQTGPVVDVLMTDGRRQSIPMTAENAESNNWRKGRCLPGGGPVGSPLAMGVHWMYDVDGGKEFSWKADTFFPVVPMYHETTGTINGIFFQVPKKMQNYDVTTECPTPLPPAVARNTTLKQLVEVCIKDTNMWDGSPGLAGGFPPRNPFLMCANFCKCPPTGFEDTATFATMHWFFTEDRGLCTYNVGAGKFAPDCGPIFTPPN